ncbi:MAG: hypothetical protein RMJ15_03925 [Nitrososphaerota archaeon]|nr:hypothetical protein [Candidatus Bathyarchaeota archaeon]MDW8022872.1 hypothetical protein [Nitrososphaerota archaeon]
MKRVAVIIRQREINKFFPQAFQLTLKDEASIIDALKAVDEEIKKRANVFPIGRYKSLLQMVYHPIEKRFYKQVAIHANVKSKPINIRENPTAPLPDETTIILIPENGCQTDWEEPI